ncbi:LuxR C-terminal-related transcriptional regulator [Streptomyces sp. I05A-00742]|uniref:LuxR C-terminal-related transcriptional regulator n=1 Tax=Streptomyces sp. I05A-00742 TaxID=2732853 RepID=UPI0014888A90|nr:LuxR C-terminal-related transcriptional regulator [Streptomyces sp. I05A-00742]
MPSTGHALPEAGRCATLAWSGDPLLGAKLSVPPSPRTHVPRHRLFDRLDAGTAGPLTLVTGPAGAGKSTLAAAWARTGGPPGPVAWLTLDARDSAPGVFWSYVLEALRRALPRLPDSDGIPAPASPGGVGTSLLTRLAAATERLPGPVVLVLDGFERVTGRRVPAGLEFLLDHAGPRLRLVVTGRTDPLLPLHRYRTEDRIAEIRGADLAFTSHEAAVLLREHGLRPEDDTVRAFTERAEGWAAGLRLCALAERRTGGPAGPARPDTLAGQAVSDYLLAEVLDVRPAAVRELLLRTSVLDLVHPDLANALTGRGDAEAVLARLARENAFVDPVPGTDRYRVHPLFADVLRDRLRIRHPALVPRLHARAARGLAGTGDIIGALEHAAEAGDWAYGASQAVRHLLVGPLLATAEAERVERVFGRMPSSVPGAAPALMAAACRLARHDGAGCREHLAAAERHLRRGGGVPAPEVGLTHVLLRLLCGPHPDEQGPEETARAVSDLMEALPVERAREHPEIEALRLHGLARALMGSGRLDDARRLCAASAAACTTEATRPLRHRSLGLLALAESAQGALTSAEDHALRSLVITDRQAAAPDHRSCSAYLALAVVSLERDDADVARRRLEQALACADLPGDPVPATEAAVLRSRLELSRGHSEAALAALPRHPAAVHGQWPAGRLALTRSAVALARGDHEAAVASVHDIRADGPAPLVALARAHLAAGRSARAARLLARVDRSPRLTLPDRVTVQLARAHLALLADDRPTARYLVGQALNTARPERLRRPFLEAGPWLHHLMDSADGTAPTRSRDAWLAPGENAGPPVPVQPLSGREREVLVCVQRMMSADEIAAELGLSVNTVKTHLRSVYRKLCVSRRRDAVERGRELRIL